jgi:hypothetical protein
MDWIYLAQVRGKKLAVVNAVMNHQVPQNSGKTIRFSICILLVAGTKILFYPTRSEDADGVKQFWFGRRESAGGSTYYCPLVPLLVAFQTT